MTSPPLHLPGLHGRRLLPGGHHSPDLLRRQTVFEPQVAPQVGYLTADPPTQRARGNSRVDLLVVVQRVSGEVEAAADLAAVRSFWRQRDSGELSADMGVTQSRIMSRPRIKCFLLESWVDLNRKMESTLSHESILINTWGIHLNHELNPFKSSRH